jgi:hypothetical protein
MPQTIEHGWCQICTVVTHRGNTFDLLFFEKYYGVRFYTLIDTEDRINIVTADYKSHHVHECLSEKWIVRYLPVEAQLLVLYRLFIDMKRKCRDAAYAADADAAYAAAYAAYAAADAAYADAVYAAYADAVYAADAPADADKKAKEAFRKLMKFRRVVKEAGQ